MSVIGVKSSARAPAPRPRPSPRVQGWPVSAASQAAARFGVPAMPPNATRASATIAALQPERERAADGRDILVEALGELGEADQRAPARGAARRLRSTNSPGAGPACRRRGRSLRAAWCGARFPGAGRASRRARSAPAACRRSASRWRCCRRSVPALRTCSSAEPAQQFAERRVQASERAAAHRCSGRLRRA